MGSTVACDIALVLVHRDAYKYCVCQLFRALSSTFSTELPKRHERQAMAASVAFLQNLRYRSLMTLSSNFSKTTDQAHSALRESIGSPRMASDHPMEPYECISIPCWVLLSRTTDIKKPASPLQFLLYYLYSNVFRIGSTNSSWRRIFCSTWKARGPSIMCLAVLSDVRVASSKYGQRRIMHLFGNVGHSYAIPYFRMSYIKNLRPHWHDQFLARLVVYKYFRRQIFGDLAHLSSIFFI